MRLVVDTLLTLGLTPIPRALDDTLIVDPSGCETIASARNVTFFSGDAWFIYCFVRLAWYYEAALARYLLGTSGSPHEKTFTPLDPG